MRKFALSIAAVLMLAAPAAAQAGDRDKLTAGEARSATRAWVTIQVEALQQFPGLTVTSTRVTGRVDRIGRRRMIVPVAFTLRWDGGPTFVCLNRVYVTEQGRSIRAHPGMFDCD
jgi:hypothetical protein